MAKGIKIINKNSGGMVDVTLFLSWIGAVVYFVSQNKGFGGFVVAVLQSFVWPAYVAYHVLALLHA